MMDSLYENIGGKIKNWAKWIFIVEAIGAIITGLVFLFTDEDFILCGLYGLLIMILGPIVAWVGSGILYAFGELVEDVHAMRNQEIPTMINPTAMPSTTPTYTAESPVVRAAPVAGGWTCTCGRNHASYESSCICGVSKHEAKMKNNQNN